MSFLNEFRLLLRPRPEEISSQLGTAGSNKQRNNEPDNVPIGHSQLYAADRTSLAEAEAIYNE
jgi:hypothetical protein